MKYLNDINECSIEELEQRGVVVIFGEESVRKYEDLGIDEKISLDELKDLGDVKIVMFDTTAERNAYVQGIEDTAGWLEIAFVEPSELV